MKPFFALVFFSLSVLSSRADCSGSGISVWPLSKSIKQNATFILTGYANSQEIITGLGKKYHPYLVSRNDEVDLVVSGIYTGQFELTQAILTPARLSRMGEKYELVLENLSPKFSNIRAADYDLNRVWEVSAAADLVKPQCLAAPREKNKWLRHFGCGPESYVVFSTRVKDESDIVIKATVSDYANKSSTYYVNAVRDSLHPDTWLFFLGNNMCSGAFYFEPGKTYRASFAVMDDSGNAVSCWAEKVKFVAPE